MPDLILIDYMMPGFNGVEALERVHLNQLLQDVPIVLMSASKEPPSTKKLWTYFLKKPFDIEELLDLLNHFLKKSNIKLANSG
jgi:CheY-like chemotaxis protein